MVLFKFLFGAVVRVLSVLSPILDLSTSTLTHATRNFAFELLADWDWLAARTCFRTLRWILAVRYLTAGLGRRRCVRTIIGGWQILFNDLDFGLARIWGFRKRLLRLLKLPFVFHVCLFVGWCFELVFWVCSIGFCFLINEAPLYSFIL